jgi:hypothetical protein
LPQDHGFIVSIAIADDDAVYGGVSDILGRTVLEKRRDDARERTQRGVENSSQKEKGEDKPAKDAWDFLRDPLGVPQNVHATKLQNHLRSKPVYCYRIAGVGGENKRSPSHSRDLAGHFLNEFSPSAYRDDVSTCPGKAESDGAADSARSTNHDRDSVGQIKCSISHRVKSHELERLRLV